jgi:hypothetical protein
MAICRYFCSIMEAAVDAVGTFSAFTYGLLIAPRVSFCRNAMPMHLASDYIHPLIRRPGDVPLTAAYGSTYPTICVTLPWFVCSELPHNTRG